MLCCENLASDRLEASDGYSRLALLRSVVIFIKYCEVSTHTILPNFVDLSAETALYSHFGGGVGKKGKKEEAYVRQVLNWFNSILVAN